MDPVSLVIAIWISGYVVRSVGGDLIADIKGRERPSQTRARQRHERRLARGEQPNPTAGYLGRLIENGAERLAERSDQKHAAKLAWLNEQKDRRSQQWLDRKRADFTDRLARAAADKAGVLRDKTRGAVADARDRHAEDQAHRRNQSEPDLIDRDDWHPDHEQVPTVDDGDADELADVLDFPSRRDTTEPDSQQDSDLPMLEFTERRRDDGTVEIQVSTTDDPERASNVRGDPSDPLTWTGTDRYGRDIQTGRRGSYTDSSGCVVHDDDTYRTDVSPERNLVSTRQFRRDQGIPDPTDREDSTETDDVTTDENSTAPTSKGELMTEQQAAPQSVSPEITNLTQAKAYTSGMSGYLSQVHSAVEASTGDIKQLATDVAAERANAELAAASARAQGMNGAHVAALDRAAEGLAILQGNLESAAESLDGVPDAATAATGHFDSAHDEFDSQTGIAEQVQAAGDAAANNTDFYANA